MSAPSKLDEFEVGLNYTPTGCFAPALLATGTGVSQP